MGSDFNGDGRDDILWWNRDSGAVSNWLGTANGGFTINDANALHHVPSTWRAIGTGDYNGDDRDDILWWNSNAGQISNWLGTANGGFIINDTNALLNLFHFQNSGGDFNGDGRDDLFTIDYDVYSLTVWQGTVTGKFAETDQILQMHKPAYGDGDFNGDGRSDFLWRDTLSGDVGNWLTNANGEFVLNPAVNAKASADWEIVGIGDFNGDGRDDILWRNNNGALSDWLGNADGSYAVNDVNAFTHVPTNWRVVDTGDYNGDNRDDILWRNSDTGAVSNWLGTASGGFIINDAAAYVVVPTSWFVMPNPTGAGEWDY